MAVGTKHPRPGDRHNYQHKDFPMYLFGPDGKSNKLVNDVDEYKELAEKGWTEEPQGVSDLSESSDVDELRLRISELELENAELKAQLGDGKKKKK